MAKRTRTADETPDELPEGHRPPEDREAKACPKCGVSDTHSKHTQYAAFKHPITGETLDISIEKHIHCCAEDGCEICQTDLEHAENNGVAVDGASHELTDYMQNKTDDHHRELFERHGVESHLFSKTPDVEEEAI